MVLRPIPTILATTKKEKQADQTSMTPAPKLEGERVKSKESSMRRNGAS